MKVHSNEEDIQLKNHYSEQEMRMFISDLIDMFADMQRKRIAHRNIKPSNILVMDQDSLKQVRIQNFELAIEIQSNLQMNDSSE